MSRVEPRELRRYRQFYLVYSRIRESLTPELRRLSSNIGLPVPEIRDSVSPEFVLAGTTLITSLSFTHLSELIAIDDPLERAFYEVECIRGSWSVLRGSPEAYRHRRRSRVCGFSVLSSDSQMPCAGGAQDRGV